MRGGTGRILIVAVYSTLAGLLVPPSPASATVDGCPAFTRAEVISAMPYPQQRWDIDRLTPLSTGDGVTVAVIDSGVDGDHPQLRGRVANGRDFLGNRSDGLQDCKGHGTGVAGIIAAAPADPVEFHGLAPEAQILPVRVTERTEDERPAAGAANDPQAEIDKFAAAINWAVDNDADVINLSLTLGQDDDGVRAAISRAVRNDVVVVAAAGNGGAPDKANPTPYPAAYSGVLGVGAITPNGARSEYSQHGPYVDVTAPGDGVITTAAGGGHQKRDGTSFATPFVSATAALIIQRFPDLRGREVVERIIDTADPAPGGRRSDEYGSGIVNPYRALTETVVPSGAGRVAAVPLPTEDPAIAAAQARRVRARTTALRFAAIGAGVTAVVVLAVLVVPNGRRRRWSPAGRG
jgi:type VII secretion-associated serine protease mycosin